MSAARSGVRRVTTSLPKGLWALAEKSGVAWAEALRGGVIAVLERRGVNVPAELHLAPAGSTSPVPPPIGPSVRRALHRSGWMAQALRASALGDEALADELARTVPGVGATLARRIVTEARRGG